MYLMAYFITSGSVHSSVQTGRSLCNKSICLGARSFRMRARTTDANTCIRMRVSKEQESKAQNLDSLQKNLACIIPENRGIFRAQCGL